MLYHKDDDISLYHDDFLESYDELDGSSIDLIITSPPYNTKMKYSKYNDVRDYSEYLEFMERWLWLCYLLLKPSGRMCLNIPLDNNVDGKKSVYVDVLNIARKYGWEYQSTIIWDKKTISKRTAWGSWKSPSAPHIIPHIEVILVLYKHQWKKIDSVGKKSDIERDEFISWTNGIWEFAGEKAKKIGHPAPFPQELPYRCIKLFSYIGDVILDPFVGSGTTLLKCKKLNRVGHGFEIDKDYCEIAKNRLLAIDKSE